MVYHNPNRDEDKSTTSKLTVEVLNLPFWEKNAIKYSLGTVIQFRKVDLAEASKAHRGLQASLKVLMDIGEAFYVIKQRSPMPPITDYFSFVFQNYILIHKP